MNFRVGILILVLSASMAVAAPDWSFQTTPADGVISGSPGSTIGWGYTIMNLDATLWLLLNNLTADPFTNATPESLFDFPTVAPLSQATGPLYQITWDTGLAAGTFDEGVFTASATWYDADPANGGMPVIDAPDRLASYRAEVSAAVPEPASSLLVGLAVLSATLVRLTRRGQPQGI
jgi:hypothetical protein